MNLGELVRLDVGISRTLGLIQKPSHAAVATHRTNSLQLLRQIDCRCAVINTEEVTGQTIVPIFGELTNLGDGIEPPQSFNLGGRYWRSSSLSARMRSVLVFTADLQKAWLGEALGPWNRPEPFQYRIGRCGISVSYTNMTLP